VAGLALGIGAWLLDVAAAQQQQQQPRVPPKKNTNPNPFQPVQQARPAPQPVRPLVKTPPPAPINNPGTPIIGGQIIRSPQAGITPITGMSGSYLGNLPNTGYLGGVANGNLFLNPNLAAGGFNPWFGQSWGQPWGGFNSWGNTWGNPWMNTWGNPFANPWMNTFNNPFANPFNQFPMGANPWNINPVINPYGMMNLNGMMNPYGMMNPFQMGFPQNGPFGPTMPNPFLQQGNAFLGGGFNGGQVVGQQPQQFQPQR